ncbi:DUF2637 domain-containing protein [Streptomyces sp. JNUCC 64]
MNTAQIRSAERALSVGTWMIVGGAMLYSVLTVTPLMAAHTADEWDWTAPILPVVVDAAVVIVVKLDDVLARLGADGGRWPVVLRWMTGLMTLALNIADSALKGDLVGVAVHAVAPMLLIVTAETSLSYRRAIAAAVTRLNAEERAERERARGEREARERAGLERREAADRRAREEREHTAALAREQREHEARLAREQTDREHAARAAERAEREARERAEREAREHAAQVREQVEREREHRAREAEQRRTAERLEREAAARREAEEEAERAAREHAAQVREQAERAREHQEREARERAALLSGGPVTEKQPEEHARRIVAAAYAEGLAVRTAAELCGWSVGWVSGRYAEHRDPGTGGAPLAIAR